ncbi:MAG: rane protein [Mucilaginibacter sp.]|nr:rane protein [Mucilaginibacter sp.]
MGESNWLKVIMDSLKLNDWSRIFIGSVPGEFYLELIIRAVVVYLILTVSMRMMGKRMSSQLGRTEMAATVSLAAAIGVPLQAPDRGLLAAVVIALVIICVQIWIAAISFKNPWFEKFTQGNIDVLIKDGILDLKNMERVRLSRERLVAQLRSEGIKQLGMVNRFYMEANGSFTLIEENQVMPGLSVIPRWDKKMNDRFKKSDKYIVCQTCGYRQELPFDDKQPCPNCKDCKWTVAVT